jgi:hypothetical protein
VARVVEEMVGAILVLDKELLGQMAPQIQAVEAAHQEGQEQVVANLVEMVAQESSSLAM